MDGRNIPYGCSSDDAGEWRKRHAVYLRKLVRCRFTVAQHHGTVIIDYLHGDFRHAIPADDRGKSLGWRYDQSGNGFF